MSKEDLYLQAMCDYFEYNCLANDAMCAFKEAAPDAFKDFCKEQLVSSIPYSRFIDQLYEFDEMDDEMLDFAIEVYGDKFGEEKIEKCWEMHTDKYVIKAFDNNHDSLYAVMSGDEGTVLEGLTENINEATVFYDKDDADTVRAELDDTRPENFTVSFIQDEINYELYKLPANETFTIEDWNGHKGINIIFCKDKDFHPEKTDDDYNVVQISVTANGKEIGYSSDIHVDEISIAQPILSGDFDDFENTDKSLEDIVSNAEKENEIER
jgi:hypothetical protein